MRLEMKIALFVLSLSIFSVAFIDIIEAVSTESVVEKRAEATLESMLAADVNSVDSKVNDAIAKRDAVRLRGLLDDGFLLTNTLGDVYDKAKFLHACCAGQAVSKILLLGSTESQVKTYGDTAVVASRTEMRFTKDNQEQKLAWRSTRTYVRSGGRWKLAAEQRTSSR
jgi:ketosteroid isomerase-like protein